MNIIVLGSGVVGVATAWYLRQSGHDVTVIDKESDVAMGTSAGNAGQISPGYAAPWAAPGIPFKAIKWMFEKHAPLSIRPDGTPFQLSWMWQMLMNCNASSYSENKGRMVRLSEYSRDCLKDLRAQIGLTYEDRQRGTLQIFRTEQQYKSAAKDISVLQDAGVAYELLGPDQLAAAEPALAAVAHKLTGGLRLPNDETGDCQLFTQRLAKMAEAAGVKFKFNTAIDAILTQNNQVTGIQSNGEMIKADAYVVALGSFSKGLLKGLVDIPVYPVKGYSLTIPIADASCAPTSTVLDETYKIALTRFDQRIRVGGMAELVGFSDELLKARRETLEMVTQDLFPNGGHIDQATFWTGLRPMTPDGTPIIGQCGPKNLWLNTGHGTLGWTMACGSGKLLSDMISEAKTEIEYRDLNLSRYVA